jgi:uncharacterized protein with von Willebrand factor type A (vWA) domain
MFSHLILGLRSAGLPASITEYLTLMAAMKAGVADYSVEDFYYLARATLVKDERHLDKFDRVFGACFKGLEPPEGVAVQELPEEWLLKLAEKLLSPEEMKKIEALGGFEAIMKRLKELLAEQNVTRVDRNGSARRGRLRLGPMATTRKACGSGRINRATGAR